MWEQDREWILGRGRVVGSGSEGPWALACTGQTNESLSPNSLVLQGYLVGLTALAVLDQAGFELT